MLTKNTLTPPLPPPSPPGVRRRWPLSHRASSALIAVGTLFGIASVQAESDANRLRVAVLASESAPTEFDAALKELGWKHEKFQDSAVGWTALEKKAGEFDLILTSPGLRHFFPRKAEGEAAKARVEALRSFTEKGGAIVQTGATEPEQLEWLELLNEKLALTSEETKGAQAKDVVTNARVAHPLYFFPSDLEHSTKGAPRFYKPVNAREWEQGAFFRNQSCLLVRREGKGYIAVSTLSLPNAGLLRNAAALLRLQRMGLSFQSVQFFFEQTGERNAIVQGRGRAELNLFNTSDKPVAFSGYLRVTNGKEVREVSAALPAAEAKKGAKLVLPVTLDLTGKTKVEVALNDPKSGQPILFREVEVDLPEFMTVIPPAYRGLLSTARRDKNVHFQMSFAPLPEKVEGTPLTLTIIGPDEKEISRKELTVKVREFPVVMDLPADAPVGEYRIIAKTIRQGVLPVEAEGRFKILPVRPGQVVVDQDTVLLKDGKPFFPIGLYHVTHEQIDDVAELGVNFVQFWDWYANPESMDHLQRKGIQALWEGHAWGVGIHLNPHRAMESEKFRQQLDLQRKAVEQFKNHPALSMWYVADEPSPSRVPLLHHINNAWHEADEDHPTYLVATGDYEKLHVACDVLGIDVYPIYRGRRNPLTIISDATDAAMRGVNYRKPVIAIPQSFGFNEQHKEKPEEVRAMSYLFLTHGVKGIIWYCWKETGDKTGAEGAAYHPETQKVLKELIGEIKTFAPALMEPGARQIRSTDGKVHAILCGSDATGRYLLLVNGEEVPAKSVLEVPELDGRKLTGLFGTKDSVVKNGQLALDLAPIATGVFEIK